MAPHEEGRTQGSILAGLDRSILVSVPKALCDSKGVTIVMSETEGGRVTCPKCGHKSEENSARYSCKSSKLRKDEEPTD